VSWTIGDCLGGCLIFLKGQSADEVFFRLFMKQNKEVFA